MITLLKQFSHCEAERILKSCNNSALCKKVKAHVRTGLRESQQNNAIPAKLNYYFRQ
jgi:hypothetical protein